MREKERRMHLADDLPRRRAVYYLRASLFICGCIVIVSPVFADDNRSLFETGEKFFKEKNYKEAKKALNQVVAKASPLEDYIPKARLLLANLQEDFTVSIGQFKILAAEYAKRPEGEEAQRNLGARYYMVDKYEDAIFSYKEFLQDYPKSLYLPEARYWLASSLMALDKNREALEEFKRVVEKSPDNPWAPKALLGMATVCLRLNQPAEAQKYLLKVLDQYRLYEELNLVYLKLGQAYEARRMPKEAYAAYRTLLEDYPRSFEVTEARIRMEALEGGHPELKVKSAHGDEWIAPATPTMVVAAVPGPTEAAPEGTPPEGEPTKVPEEPAEAAPTPTQPPLEAAVPKPFHVQVGVFSKSENVKKKKKELEDAGYQTYTVMVKDPSVAYPLFKVRVGHFGERASAEKLARELTRKLKEKAIVVED